MRFRHHVLYFMYCLPLYAAHPGPKKPETNNHATATLASNELKTTPLHTTPNKLMIPCLAIESCNSTTSPHHGKRRNAIANAHTILSPHEKALLKK